MRLPAERWPAVLHAWALAALLVTAGLLASTQLLAAEGSPTEAQVRSALDAVKADPNLATQTTRRSPSFGKDDDEEKPDEPRTRFPNVSDSWLGNLFSWVSETSRALLWVVGIILGALLVLALLRIWGKVDWQRDSKKAAALPTHVRDLDIRPESLPDEIGATALGLWNQGEHRAALVLLYRGLVSRLVHVHSLPIRESTTEAGCVELARVQLPAELTDYVEQLVRCWQCAVYGGMEPADAEFRALCSSFDTALAPPIMSKAA